MKGYRPMPIFSENTIQGNDIWFADRLGIPSSSRFNEILTATGIISKQRQKYLNELAGEKIVGVKPGSYKSAAMIRGAEMEAEARMVYAMEYEVDVKQVGVCFPDENRKYCSSPDGLVNNNGLIEIKCCTLPVAVEYLLKGKLPTIYYVQCQGQLLVTGRKWVDFFSYYPNLPSLTIRVEREPTFLSRLEEEIEKFSYELAILVNKLKAM